MSDAAGEAGASAAPEARVRDIEARARRAWPALEEDRIEGWVLRWAAGATRRSNSIHAVDPVRDLPAALDRAVAWCSRRNLPPRFHIHPAVRPAGLDEALAERGWIHELGAQVQVGDLGDDPVDPRDVGRTGDGAGAPGPDWLGPFAEWRGMDDAARASHLAVLERVPPPRIFARVGEAGRTRAVGLAVRDGEWLGLFDLVTDPATRRVGWGRFLVRRLLAWGRAGGARHAYLQVEDRNVPAIRLYESLGFRLAYAYGYRLAPGVPDGARAPSDPDSTWPTAAS